MIKKDLDIMNNEGNNDLVEIHAKWLLLKSGSINFADWLEYMVQWTHSQEQEQEGKKAMRPNELRYGKAG